MGSNNRLNEQESNDRLAALHTNTSAIRAISAAVEATFGPKGLDTMLMDASGEVIITNDGVTILNKMEVNHPAAKMLINAARSQQSEIGDGTTTATILSSELLTEAVNHVSKGVPIPKMITGIREGILLADKKLKELSRPIASLEEKRLYQIAWIAGREHEDLAHLIVEAAQLVGLEKLKDPHYTFSDSIIAHEGSRNELITGLVLSKKRMNTQMPKRIDQAKVLMIQDAFEPEEIDDEALGTEVGFSKYLEYKASFKENMKKIVDLGINVIAVDRGVDPVAEEFCVDHGIMVIQRLLSQEMKRLAEHTGAKMIKRTGLHKNVKELEPYLGYAASVVEDEKLNKVQVIHGKGKPMATILIGASTGEIVDERERMAKDAAASVQAAVRSGYVPGGGAIELYIARELEKHRDQIRGMEGFGVQAVAAALKKPFAQIVHNAGYNSLEKVEEVKAAQIEKGKDSIGVDTDNGTLIDMEEAGVVDPSLVKIHALKAAGEIAEAILRIHTIIRMKKEDQE